jgi:hypothetical protein
MSLTEFIPLEVSTNAAIGISAIVSATACGFFRLRLGADFHAAGEQRASGLRDAAMRR